MKRCCLLLLLMASAAFGDDGALRVATIGDLRLEDGEVIRDCRIGYRTYGQLASDRSNVVVVLTWLGGTTEGLAGWIGPDKLYDSSTWYIVSIDALGDGVSSSPSNSKAQPGERFPHFTFRDMVHSQHELLTRELKLQHVHAISGLSMGGIQTYQWVVSYPEFMDLAIPIVGTPRQTSYDLLLWKTELSLVESQHNLDTVAAINEMQLRTPSYTAAHTAPEKVDDLLQSHAAALKRIDPLDYKAVLRAMIGHDIGRDLSGIRARILVVAAEQDHTVNPAPSIEFARQTQSELLTLPGDCGHLATTCHTDVLVSAVHRFLHR